MGPKRNLTLDLNAPAAGSGKRLRSNKAAAATGAAAAVLTSPDVQRLGLNSPQMREFLTRNPSGATPTPSGGGWQAQTEQEMLVKQFDQAMKKGGGLETTTAAVTRAAKQMSGGGALLLPSTIAETVQASSLDVKQEPDAETEQQRHPTSQKGRGKASGSRSSKRSSSSVASNSAAEKSESETESTTGGSGGAFAPIDMDCQEQIKLDRKRQRNRLAATKCRKKKLEKISQLEEKVNELKSENSDLGAVLRKLKDNVSNLKVEVMEHVQSGCQIDMTS